MTGRWTPAWRLGRQGGGGMIWGTVIQNVKVKIALLRSRWHSVGIEIASLRSQLLEQNRFKSN